MPTLYHFEHSPFSRRTRLALAHKGLNPELREARSRPEWLDEARSHVPHKTIPVLVDGQHALGDSTAITRWLDAAYPDGPRIWPVDPEGAFATVKVAAWVDVALNGLVDLGTRYFPLREHPAWSAVAGEVTARVQRALDALAERVRGLGRTTIAESGWGAGDMWLYTAVAWMQGMPARAGHSPNIAQILTVGGWTLPEALGRWADGHRGRADVRALG